MTSSKTRNADDRAGGANRSPDNTVLKHGATGTRVRELTRLLVSRGFLAAEKTHFDTPVKRAVEGFQARHIGPNGRPLVVDGVVGPLTWWALRHPSNTGLLNPPDAAPSIPRGGSSVGRAALRIALAEMEAGSREIGGNNRGQFVAKYLNGIIDPPANWCAAFVSWCFDQTPQGIPFEYSLGARDIRTQFRRRGWAFDARDETPQPGDIVAWWRGQPDSWMGHIGFVLRVQDGILYTVEGNKGGFPAPVNTFDYVLSRMDRLLGFGRAE